MAILRVEPIIYLFTPLGVAECHFYETPSGFETNPLWHCFQRETKEPWVWPNPMVRLCESISGSRSTAHSDFELDDAYFETLRPHILRHKKSPLYQRASHLVRAYASRKT